MSKKTAIQTDTAPAAIGPYSQAIRAGDLLFCSGQIPLDPATGDMISGTIEEETQQVMKNISAVLAAAGLGFEHVVKTTIFLKDLGHFARVNEVYGSYFMPPFPARSTVQISHLPKAANVEIEVIAKVFS